MQGAHCVHLMGVACVPDPDPQPSVIQLVRGRLQAEHLAALASPSLPVLYLAFRIPPSYPLLPPPVCCRVERRHPLPSGSHRRCGHAGGVQGGSQEG